MIAAHHQGDDTAVAAVDHERLDAARRIDLEQLRQGPRSCGCWGCGILVSGSAAGCAARWAQWWRPARGWRRSRRRPENAMASSPESARHVKFLGGAAADAAAIGLYGPELQADAREKCARIGPVHAGKVALRREAGLNRMKRVRILHQEFARAHDAETRADFVTELELNLIEIDRQLLVSCAASRLRATMSVMTSSCSGRHSGNS